MSEWTASNVWETSQPVIRIGEDEIPVNPTDDFKSTVMRVAMEHGLSRFVVVADEREIAPEDAPANFEGLQVVEIKPYDKAG